jgi:hypothetical protein
MSICTHCQHEIEDGEPRYSYASQVYHARCHDTVGGHAGVLALERDMAALLSRSLIFAPSLR